MAKILANHKNVVLIIMLSMLLLLSSSSIDSLSLASDAETSESSTSQTYYDYLIDYQQKQTTEFTKFKAGISRNIADLEKDLLSPNFNLKSGQLKYTHNKGSVVLGSLYGSKGKLGLDKSTYRRSSDILSSATAMTDTETFKEINTGKNSGIGNKGGGNNNIENNNIINSGNKDGGGGKVVCSQVCNQVCRQECRQIGYGRTCAPVCTPVCTTVCN